MIIRLKVLVVSCSYLALRFIHHTKSIIFPKNMALCISYYKNAKCTQIANTNYNVSHDKFILKNE